MYRDVEAREREAYGRLERPSGIRHLRTCIILSAGPELVPVAAGSDHRRPPQPPNCRRVPRRKPRSTLMRSDQSSSTSWVAHQARTPTIDLPFFFYVHLIEGGLSGACSFLTNIHPFIPLHLSSHVSYHTRVFQVKTRDFGAFLLTAFLFAWLQL